MNEAHKARSYSHLDTHRQTDRQTQTQTDIETVSGSKQKQMRE